MFSRVKERISDRYFWLDVLIIILLFVAYCFHATRMSDWIMDDAGISFVYSRNLARGYGLVSQPGRTPVEGYSNPLWVFLFVPFFWLNLFDPIVTPKVISALLILLSLIFLYLGTRRILRSRILAVIVCALTVAHTSFTVWTISGMENPLYVFLAILMFWIIATHSDRNSLPTKLGILVGLAALARSEGLIYGLVFPLYLVLESIQDHDSEPWNWRTLAKDMGRFLLPIVVIAGGYFIFRLLYFHDILPNTYYAKGVGSFQLDRWLRLITLHEDRFEKIILLTEMILGRLSVLCLMILVISVTHFVTASRFSGRRWAALILFIPAALAYVMLPADWMGEYRFATTVIPFFYMLLVQFGQAWIAYLPVRPSWQKAVLWLVLIVFLGFNIKRHVRRTQNFAAAPPTPFTTVAVSYGRAYDYYAERLGLEDASVLLPDMGGTLYYSNLIVYDLGALTDRTIARTLRRDTPAFHDYVFEDIKPTFIEAYSGWAQFAEFDEDPRFRRDYVPIREQVDQALLEFGIEIYSGTYVRKDALLDLSQLELLR